MSIDFVFSLFLSLLFYLSLMFFICSGPDAPVMSNPIREGRAGIELDNGGVHC